MTSQTKADQLATTMTRFRQINGLNSADDQPVEVFAPPLRIPPVQSLDVEEKPKQRPGPPPERSEKGSRFNNATPQQSVAALFGDVTLTESQQEIVRQHMLSYYATIDRTAKTVMYKEWLNIGVSLLSLVATGFAIRAGISATTEKHSTK